LPRDRLVSDEAGYIRIETLAKCVCPFGRATKAKGGHPLFVGNADSAPGRVTLGGALAGSGLGGIREGGQTIPFRHIHSAISKASQPRAGNPTPQKRATCIIVSFSRKRYAFSHSTASGEST